MACQAKRLCMLVSGRSLLSGGYPCTQCMYTRGGFFLGGGGNTVLYLGLVRSEHTWWISIYMLSHTEKGDIVSGIGKAGHKIVISLTVTFNS